MRKVLFLICLLAIPFMCSAQEIQKGTTVAKYNVLPDNYNFWLYTPSDYEPKGHPLPLVIFLHGRSLCGTDLNKVKKYGVIDAINRGKIVPSVVIAPQTQSSWKANKLAALTDWMIKNYNIDSTRVYVLGMSLGGYGTMDFCSQYPEKIAAGMALCGGCSYKTPDGLSKLPFWIMHGTADEKVGINCSKRVVEYLQQNCNTDLLRYDWLQGGNHGIYARLFYLQKTYDWLFSHSTTQRPRKVDKTFDITKQDMDQTYSELRWFKDMKDVFEEE